jgi:sugar-specific transcriptional regulator TrmB
MSIHQQLKSIGLNHSEISVYLFLLENGVSTPPIVSRGTKIARTNCYNVLQALEEKGLIEKNRVGGKKTYVARDPEALLRSWQRKKDTIEQLIPDLRGIYTTQINKPKVQFYEGEYQVQEIYQRSLKAKEIMAIGSTNQLSIALPEFTQYYFRELKRLNIIFYDILSKDSEKMATNGKDLLKGLYDFRLLGTENKDLPTDILIWDDSIALISLSQPLFGTVLTNKYLAQTFKGLFRLIWDK